MGLTAEDATARTWERCYELAAHWAPHVTLVVGTALALGTGGADRGTSALLAGITLAWVLLVGPRRPDHPRGPLRFGQTGIRIYLAGFVLLSAVLNLTQGMFFVVAVAAFFQAWLVQPRVAKVLVVLGASAAVNLQIIVGGADPGTEWTALRPDLDALVVYLVVLVIQTAAISAGLVVGETLEAQSERRRRTVEDLEAALAENTRLQAQLVERARDAGVADERARLAREVHDTIAQGLVAIITQLEAAGRAAPHDAPRELRRRIDVAQGLARDHLAEARRAVHAIRPLQLEGRRLPDALADVARRWADATGVPAQVVTTGTPTALHPEVEVTVLRVTQEGLANAARHAGASRVGVTLSYMADVVAVDVRDDGRGMDPARLAAVAGVQGGADGPGFGLTAMRQRVEGLAGDLQIESEPGGGTAVSATLPALPPGGDGSVDAAPPALAPAGQPAGPLAGPPADRVTARG